MPETNHPAPVRNAAAPEIPATGKAREDNAANEAREADEANETRAADDVREAEDASAAEARPLFPHRPWMEGIVLILAVLAILGGWRDPIWFGVGLPFIIALALTIYVRVRQRLRRENDPEE